MTEVVLKRIEDSDITELWKISATEEWPEWKNWNAPYFDDYKKLDYDTFIKTKADFYRSDRVKGIYIDGSIVGMVSKYWENKNTLWLEVGIVIYNPIKWGEGIGKQALSIWIDEIFLSEKELEHIGMTTWSGNIRMIKLAEKLGMKQEACIRKVRFYKSIYYDSIKYGILREEWENKR